MTPEKPWKQRLIYPALGCTLLGIVLFTAGAFMAMLGWFHFSRLHEIPFSTRTAARVARAVVSGGIYEDRRGVYRLPPGWGGLTVDGNAYVTRKSDGLVLIMFPTWRGKGGECVGYLYSSRPITERDIHRGDPTHPSMLLLCPDPDADRQTSMLEVGMEDVPDPSWRKISHL